MHPVPVGVIAVLSFLGASVALPPGLRWLSFVLLGVIAGSLARDRSVVLALSLGAFVVAVIVAMLVAMGRGASGSFDPLGTYVEELGPVVLQGLGLPPLAAALTQAMGRKLTGTSVK